MDCLTDGVQRLACIVHFAADADPQQSPIDFDDPNHWAWRYLQAQSGPLAFGGAKPYTPPRRDRVKAVAPESGPGAYALELIAKLRGFQDRVRRFL